MKLELSIAATVLLTALPASAQPDPATKPAPKSAQPAKTSAKPAPTPAPGAAAPNAAEGTQATTEAATSEPVEGAELAAPGAPDEAAVAPSIEASDRTKSDAPQLKAKADAATATESVVDSTPPTPKAPLNSWLSIHGYGDLSWNDDPGYDLFDDDDVGGQVGLSVELDVLDLSSSATLAVFVAASAGGVSDGDIATNVFDESSIQAENYALGIVPRYAILPWLEVHARVQGGISDIYTEFGLSSGETLAQNDLAPFGAAGAGFALLSKPRRIHPSRSSFNSVTFGGMVEGGYRLASSLSYGFRDVMADPPEQRVRVQGADLGNLDLAGPYLRFGALVRF